MAKRPINEFLSSGEAGNIVISGNMGYTAAADPAFDDMFLRVTNGVTNLYRAPDRDVHWADADTGSIAVTTSPVEILSVTPDQQLVSTDSGYQINGRLDNTQNQTRQVTMTVLFDSVPAATVTIDLDKNQINVPISYTGLIDTPVDAGTVVSVTFEADGTGVNLKGDLVATTIKITKAQSAPVVMSAEVLDSFDWNLLPTSEGEPGTLYIHQANGSLRVSQ